MATVKTRKGGFSLIFKGGEELIVKLKKVGKEAIDNLDKEGEAIIMKNFYNPLMNRLRVVPHPKNITFELSDSF